MNSIFEFEKSTLFSLSILDFFVLIDTPGSFLFNFLFTNNSSKYDKSINKIRIFIKNIIKHTI